MAEMLNESITTTTSDASGVTVDIPHLQLNPSRVQEPCRETLFTVTLPQPAGLMPRDLPRHSPYRCYWQSKGAPV